MHPAVVFTILLSGAAYLIDVITGDPQADAYEALEKEKRRNEALAFSLEAGEQRQRERLDKQVADVLNPEAAIDQARLIQSGALDQPATIPQAQGSGLLEEVANKIGMSPQDISSKLNPARTGNPRDISRQIFGV